MYIHVNTTLIFSVYEHIVHNYVCQCSVEIYFMNFDTGLTIYDCIP